MEHYTQLVYQERAKIEIFLGLNLSIREIAKRLKRHPSTIYRELNRNAQKNKYKGNLAQKRASKRKNKGIVSIKNNTNLYNYIKNNLKRGWSPEQISGRMRFLNLPYYVCHETIYRYIYSLRDRSWYYLLHYKKKNRGRLYGRKPKSCRYAEIKLIDQRPKEALTREQIGHWEGDTIIFSLDQKQNVTTLVERKTRYVCLKKNEDKCSQTVINKIKGIIQKNPKKLWKTITFDQGSEFANYREIDRRTKCKSYFSYPRSPWQRGSNENTNGRLRRYLPRKTVAKDITQELLDRISDKMNNQPRKCLGYLTPKEVLIRELLKPCRT